MIPVYMWDGGWCVVSWINAPLGIIVENGTFLCTSEQSGSEVSAESIAITASSKFQALDIMQECFPDQMYFTCRA